MKIVYTAISFLLVLLVGFFTLGYFIDASQKSVKSDLIVSLGGGYGCRIKEALRLYQNGYSNSKKFLYTGREEVHTDLKTSFSKSEFLLQGGIKKENIVFVKRGIIVNTVEELLFIKAYMERHNYKSVLIVTAPIHTRRVKTLASQIVPFDEAGIKVTVSGCKKAHWNPSSYYQDKETREAVFLEFAKLIYNLVKYSPPLISYTSYAEKKESLLWNEALEI